MAPPSAPNLRGCETWAGLREGWVAEFCALLLSVMATTVAKHTEEHVPEQHMIIIRHGK